LDDPEWEELECAEIGLDRRARLLLVRSDLPAAAYIRAAITGH
jgi:hypothetical protein